MASHRAFPPDTDLGRQRPPVEQPGGRNRSSPQEIFWSLTPGPATTRPRAARLLGFGNATTLSNWLKRHGVEPW